MESPNTAMLQVPTAATTEGDHSETLEKADLTAPPPAARMGLGGILGLVFGLLFGVVLLAAAFYKCRYRFFFKLLSLIVSPS